MIRKTHRELCEETHGGNVLSGAAQSTQTFSDNTREHTRSTRMANTASPFTLNSHVDQHLCLCTPSEPLLQQKGN